MFPRRMSLLEVRIRCRFGLVSVSGALSLSHVDVAFNVLSLTAADILSSTCSSADHFDQLAPTAFGIKLVIFLVSGFIWCHSEANML